MDYCPNCCIQVTYLDDICPCCGHKITHIRSHFLEKAMKKTLKSKAFKKALKKAIKKVMAIEVHHLPPPFKHKNPYDYNW
jgi:hypothetical protein